MVPLYVNSRIVGGFFLSWWGAPPQSFEHSIWDCLGFYTIHTFLDPLVESQFRIISKSYNFLFGTSITPSFFSCNSHFFSGQSRNDSSSSLFSCCISGLGPEGLLHNRKTPVWSPGNLLRVTLASRGNSASENLQRETQRPKCCLYETPYVAALVRETGDVIARTPLYAQLPTDAPTRTRFVFGSWVMRFSRDPSC